VRKALSAVAILGAVLTGILIPAAAHAAAPPNVVWGYSVDGDWGRIQLNAVAEAGVASIVVHIVEPDTEEVLAEVTDFTLASGDEHDGWWESGEVLLDRFCACRIEAEITDRAGVHTPARYVGNLNYAVEMFFDQLRSTPRVSFTERDFVVSGRLMGRWPGTRALAPVEGFWIHFVSQGGTDESVLSAADGTFTVTGQVRSAADSATLTTLPNWEKPHYAPTIAEIAAPVVERAVGRLTVKVDRTTVLSGTPITVTGNLSWRSPTGWAPVANTVLVLLMCPNTGGQEYCSDFGQVSTDSRGNYRFTGSPVSGDLLQVTARTEPFLTAVKQTAVTVFGQASFASFSALRESGPESGSVSVTGQLMWGRTAPATASVDIQFSENGTDGWHTVSTVNLGRNVEQEFTTTVDQPAAGWWRARYAGVPHRRTAAESGAVFVAEP
jgi:hypothetical protein